MSDSFVPRPEFDGAIESLRREFKAMGDNLSAQVGQVLNELKDMRKETGKVAVLEVKVEALEEWKRNNQKAARALWIGVTGSALAHLFSYWRH